jgi:hypothetical protein
MSRSGYNDYDGDGDNWSMIMYRGAVTSAFRGKRGQAFLKEMLAAMDALPEKKLVAHELEEEDGAVCAIGTVGTARGVDMSKIDPDDAPSVSGAFNIAEAMAREIVYVNDEDGPSKETPEERFIRMRAWIAQRIKTEEGK